MSNIFTRLINRMTISSEHWHTKGVTVDSFVAKMTGVEEGLYPYSIIRPNKGSCKQPLNYNFKLTRQGETHDFDLKIHNASDNFDHNKKTVIFFHGQRGIGKEYFSSLKEQSKDFNIFIMEYMSYAEENQSTLINNKIDVDLDLIAKQCTAGVKHLDSVLATDDYYGSAYKRNEQIVLCGYSLGTFVASKVCAKLADEENSTIKEQDNSQRVKSVDCILNYSSPIRADFLFRKQCGALLKNQYNSISAVFIVFSGAVYGISLGPMYASNKNIKRSSVLAIIPTVIADIIVASIVLYAFLSLLYYCSEVGIMKSDIKSLRAEDVHFINFKGDFLFHSNGFKKFVEKFREEGCTVKGTTENVPDDDKFKGCDGNFIHTNMAMGCSIQSSIDTEDTYDYIANTRLFETELLKTIPRYNGVTGG